MLSVLLMNYVLAHIYTYLSEQLNQSLLAYYLYTTFAVFQSVLGEILYSNMLPSSDI